MPGGCLRSALVVSWSDGGASDPNTAARALELARLLGDSSIGGFDVSTMISVEPAALRLELIRFLADRAAEDTVVVHLRGRLLVDDAGEVSFGCAAPPAAPFGAAALPLTVLEAELARCRSERIVIVIDCPADPTVGSWAPNAVGRGVALEERLAGPGRSVHQVSTATVIDALLDRAVVARSEAADALRRALRAPGPVARRARRPSKSFLGAVGVLVAVVVVASALFIATLGTAGILLSAIAVTVAAAPLVKLGVREWRQLPYPDVVLGEGVPFHELYMLRRSKKSKDHFRSHGAR